MGDIMEGGVRRNAAAAAAAAGERPAGIKFPGFEGKGSDIDIGGMGIPPIGAPKMGGWKGRRNGCCCSIAASMGLCDMAANKASAEAAEEREGGGGEGGGGPEGDAEGEEPRPGPVGTAPGGYSKPGEEVEASPELFGLVATAERFGGSGRARPPANAGENRKG